MGTGPRRSSARWRRRSPSTPRARTPTGGRGSPTTCRGRPRYRIVVIIPIYTGCYKGDKMICLNVFFLSLLSGLPVNIHLKYIFLLHFIPSYIGNGNLVLRYSVLHALPKSRGIVCRLAVLLLRRENKNIK